MRLDYTLDILAAVLLVITVIPFVVTIEGVDTSARGLWVVSTVVLGLLSIGLGYSQRPKTEAQACQVTTTQETMQQTQPEASVETPKEEAPAASAVTVRQAPAVAAPATTVTALTQVKGVGEKRAVQLKALGIKSAEDLSKASAKAVAKKMKVSPKIVDKWVTNAKELVK